MAVSSSIEMWLSSQMTVRLSSCWSAGQRRCLAGDAFFHAAVAGDHPDVVVEGAVASRGVGVEQALFVALAHRHANGGRQSLSQRSGGGFDADRVAELGVTRVRLPQVRKASRSVTSSPYPDRKSWMYRVRLEWPAERTNRSRPSHWASAGSCFRNSGTAGSGRARLIAVPGWLPVLWTASAASTGRCRRHGYRGRSIRGRSRRSFPRFADSRLLSRAAQLGSRSRVPAIRCGATADGVESQELAPSRPGGSSSCLGFESPIETRSGDSHHMPRPRCERSVVAPTLSSGGVGNRKPGCHSPESTKGVTTMNITISRRATAMLATGPLPWEVLTSTPGSAEADVSPITANPLLRLLSRTLIPHRRFRTPRCAEYDPVPATPTRQDKRGRGRMERDGGRPANLVGGGDQIKPFENLSLSSTPATPSMVQGRPSMAASLGGAQALPDPMAIP